MRNSGLAPQNILIIRDGISEGQYRLIIETELRQLKERAQAEHPAIRLTFICISKRINTRFFATTGGSYFENAVSGTVVDSGIVSANYPQFFLVSQLTNQGTVSPTSYDLLEDGMRWELVEYQRLMYQLCHLYYNWTVSSFLPPAYLLIFASNHLSLLLPLSLGPRLCASTDSVRPQACLPGWRKLRGDEL